MNCRYAQETGALTDSNPPALGELTHEEWRLIKIKMVLRIKRLSVTPVAA